MLEHCFNNFPYNSPNYDSKFINKKILRFIHDFCEQRPFIKAIYAKGSLIYGCMLEGSDIDHMRIMVDRKMSFNEKRELVNELESELQKIGVSKIQRIRENKYVRVFSDWSELKNYPRAANTGYEVYPNPNLLYAQDKEDWAEKAISLVMWQAKQMKMEFTPNEQEKWINKTRNKIFSL